MSNPVLEQTVELLAARKLAIFGAIGAEGRPIGHVALDADVGMEDAVRLMLSGLDLDATDLAEVIMAFTGQALEAYAAAAAAANSPVDAGELVASSWLEGFLFGATYQRTLTLNRVERG